MDGGLTELHRRSSSAGTLTEMYHRLVVSASGTGEHESPEPEPTVTARRKISSVTLLRNGTAIRASSAPPDRAAQTPPYVYSIREAGPDLAPAAYHSKVVFDDGAAVAWTSPIWFERGTAEPPPAEAGR